jgi:hypothetical protein
MSIGTKNEKSYLEIADRKDGFSIVARKRHARQLELTCPRFLVQGVWE